MVLNNFLVMLYYFEVCELFIGVTDKRCCEKGVVPKLHFSLGTTPLSNLQYFSLVLSVALVVRIGNVHETFRFQYMEDNCEHFI